MKLFGWCAANRKVPTLNNLTAIHPGLLRSDLRALSTEQRKAVSFLAVFSREMVTLAFQEHHSRQQALQLMLEIRRVCDEMIAGCLAKGVQPACQKGCAACCNLRVTVTPLEIMAIVNHLETCFSPGEISIFTARIAAADRVTRGLSALQRLQAQVVCPLLEDGICTVYPARPVACRVYHALAQSDCQNLLTQTGHEITVRHDLFNLSMGIFAGLSEGLRLAGLPNRHVELIAGLQLGLDASTPNRLANWLAGKAAFEAAQISNATQMERLNRAIFAQIETV